MIFNGQSVHVGHTVFDRKALTSFMIFLTLPVYFYKKVFSYSSVRVCLHKCTLVSVIESAHDMCIINMK